MKEKAEANLNVTEIVFRPASEKPANGAGVSVVLGDLADIRWEPGPAQIEREEGRRVIEVQANVRARLLASFVADAQQAVAAQVRLPPGYTISWGRSSRTCSRAWRGCPLSCPWRSPSSSCCCT
nr:efflux RND transporter permease subunit [Bradyrhizobium erythrophlei]